MIFSMVWEGIAAVPVWVYPLIVSFWVVQKATPYIKRWWFS